MIPFTDIKNFTQFNDEYEILFSMHTIFRTGDIKPLGNNSTLYQVNLQLTKDNDELLYALTERMRDEIHESNPCTLLNTAHDDQEKSLLYNQLRLVKDHQGANGEALSFFKKSCRIKQILLHSNHPDLATLYNNIASRYNSTGDYHNALVLYEKSHETLQKARPSERLVSATSHNNIASTYNNMEQYSEALVVFEKSHEIYQQILLPNHPDLTNSYDNIGSTYNTMGEYKRSSYGSLSIVENLSKIAPA
ncbi:unnamed protein product [Rotaria magnacalcarata]|uniref:Kinesin light chain n=1 Tax=Rotaria magnacalcarata TaxID=392030 RepID=A0A816NFF1_9BILA|nr:unnamed protein product [Rotaria magnacalcarata]